MYWTNVTGANSEPGNGSDWLLVGHVFEAKPTVIVNGNLMILHKSPDNSDLDKKSTLESNDIITGFWSNILYFTVAVYLGGDVDLIASWQQESVVNL